MLTLTENASTLIRSLAEQSAVAENAGLRISAGADAAQLSVDLTPAPEPDDKVIESAGARVFLEEIAALALDDKVLDAHMDDDGAVRFQVDAQA
ncbi:MAG: Fe-S cluster assembly protein HesB [Microbacteriaceae bacterium]|nr:Fe-S cluster assembly protein HesB [Microbacteriaceae bacterium]